MVRQRNITFTPPSAAAGVTAVGQPPAPQVAITGELWTEHDPPYLLWSFPDTDPMLLPQHLFDLVLPGRRTAFLYALWALLLHYLSPPEGSVTVRAVNVAMRRVPEHLSDGILGPGNAVPDRGVTITGEIWSTGDPPEQRWAWTADAPLVLPDDLYAPIPPERQARFTYAVWDLICQYVNPLELPGG